MARERVEVKGAVVSLMQRRVRWMLMLLGVQYLAGMMLNLFGSDDPAKRTIVASIAFFTHLFLGLVILVSSIALVVFVKRSGVVKWQRPAMAGFGSIVGAFLAGLGALLLKDTLAGVASLLMAVSFLAAFGWYGLLFFRLRS